MKQDVKRLRSEQSAFSPMRNAKMQCKDCLFRYDDSENLDLTMWCDMYDFDDGPKPDKIYAGKPCEYYEKELD